MITIHRLGSAKDFRVLFRLGRRREFRFFKLIYLPNKLSFSRFAFITPKTVDKRAVVRNRLRRRCREWIRKSLIPLPRALDIAITFKKDAHKATRKEFYADLKDLFGDYTEHS